MSERQAHVLDSALGEGRGEVGAEAPLESEKQGTRPIVWLKEMSGF